MSETDQLALGGIGAPNPPYHDLAILVKAGMRIAGLPDRAALREALQALGLTVTRQTVDNWFHGYSAPRGPAAVALMRVCGVVTDAGELEWWRALAGVLSDWRTAGPA